MEKQDYLAHRVNKVLLAWKDPEVNQAFKVKQVRGVSLDCLDHVVKQVYLVRKVHAVSQDKGVSLVHLASQVSQVTEVSQDCLDRWVQLDLRVREVNLDYEVILDFQVQPDRKDLKASEVNQGHKVHKALKGFVVNVANLVYEESLVHRDKLACLDHKDQKENQVI